VSASSSNPNLARLVLAAEKLVPLLDQIVFVGGSITGLLLTDPAAAPVRPTLDVDAIIAIASYAEFTEVESRLRTLGFHQSLAEGAPICRWLSGDLILDLMPTDSSILGFSNTWYAPALKHAQRIRIEGTEIRLITALYFLATKVEAFHGRGKNDFRMSHDLEDIVTVIDGRAELATEISLAPGELREYLSREFAALLSNRDFLEALPGHLLPDAASQQRLQLVLKRMQQFVVEERDKSEG
jgi:predicted nucleotidyltransferase